MVTSYAAVASVEISTHRDSLRIGESTQLSYQVFNVQKKEFVGKEVLWFSENTSIVTVSTSGLVTAVGGGKTNVYAKYKASTSDEVDTQSNSLTFTVSFGQLNQRTGTFVSAGGYTTSGSTTLEKSGNSLKLTLHSDFKTQFVLGVGVLFYIRWIFADNPGVNLEFNILKNLAIWLSPIPYFRTFDIFAPVIPFPKDANILILFLVGFSVWYKWKEKPKKLRLSLIGMSVVLVPLFLIGGNEDETRALYLLFPILYLLSDHSIMAIYNSINLRNKFTKNEQ